MLRAQQVSVSPGQTAVRPGQITVSPYSAAAPAQFDISTLLTSIMPLIMLIMVMQLIKPMMKGVAEGA